MIRHESRYKRPLIVLFSIGFLAFLTLTRLYEIPFRWAGALVGNVVYTTQEGTHWVTSGIGHVFTQYVLLVGLHDENRLLEKKVEALEGEIHRLREEEIKAKRLQRLLKFTQSLPLKFIAAEVIGRETGPLTETLMINKGTSDGIAVSQGVVTPKGVVGHVIKTFSHNAQVLLMTDTRSAMAALVQRTREEGMVHGVGQGNAHFKYLPPLAKVKKGDILITSGLEGRFAKGLRIGRIETVETVEDDFFLKVVVTPEVSFQNVEEVLVVASPQQPPPSPRADNANP